MRITVRLFGNSRTAALFLVAISAILLLPVPVWSQAANVAPKTQYLAFQCFTGSPNTDMAIGGSGTLPLGPMPSATELNSFVTDVVHRIGSTGTPQTRLAIMFGPVAFDNSDAELARLIQNAFDIAIKQKVAIGFHIDDSMFWAGRPDLLKSPSNVEWLDWSGTPTTGRRIEWGTQPTKFPPQMCFNSPAIQAEVQRRGKLVIGKAIEAGLKRLQMLGEPDLFAGVIVGWETQIGQDFDTGKYLGYHALSNLGYSQKSPPHDLDAAREQVVQSFITLWCKSFVDAGLPISKIYSHTAFLSHKVFDEPPPMNHTYSQHNHFAPPSVAFGQYRNPGFSTYPQPGLFEQIYAELALHHNLAWASSEGTDLQLGSGPGQSGMNMETYLAKMFNHGATLVNIFSWGVGGDANKKMSFRVVTEGDDALIAYRKFLSGGRLIETNTVSTSYMERLPAKVHQIQQELPAWIQKTGNQAQVQPLMQQLDTALKANDFAIAEATADKILKLLATD